MRIVVLSILLLLVVGCVGTADLIRRTYSPKKGGVVRYLNQGAQTIINARFNAAKDQMLNFCGGEYVILGSQDSATTNGFAPNTFGPGVYATQTEHTYISFECKVHVAHP